MKPEFENIALEKNEAKKRFEINVNGHYAFINYGEYGDRVALVHTEAEPGLEGTGAAAAVVEKTLQYIEQKGQKVLPFCPYVFAYIKRHPEWKRIVDEHFSGYGAL